MTHDREDEGGGTRSPYARQEAWRKRNPEKHRAHRRVQRAKRAGRIDACPCEVCGAPGEAHHDHYGKPLDVRWLCRRHHREWHRENEALLPEVASPSIIPTDEEGL
jgi:hypothetical protein